MSIDTKNINLKNNSLKSYWMQIIAQNNTEKSILEFFVNLFCCIVQFYGKNQILRYQSLQ